MSSSDSAYQNVADSIFAYVKAHLNLPISDSTFQAIVRDYLQDEAFSTCLRDIVNSRPQHYSYTVVYMAIVNLCTRNGESGLKDYLLTIPEFRNIVA